MSEVSSNFTSVLKGIIGKSREVALSFGNDYINEEHLLSAILENSNESDLLLFLPNLKNKEIILHDIAKGLRQSRNTPLELKSLPLTKNCERCIRLSVQEAKGLSENIVDTIHMVLSIINSQHLSRQISSRFNSYDKIRENYLKQKQKASIQKPSPANKEKTDIDELWNSTKNILTKYISQNDLEQFRTLPTPKLDEKANIVTFYFPDQNYYTLFDKYHPIIKQAIESIYKKPIEIEYRLNPKFRDDINVPNVNVVEARKSNKIEESISEHSSSDSLEDYIINIFKQFNITEQFEGVLDIEQQADEFSRLLTSLSFDQGMMVGLFGRWGRGKTFFWKKVWENILNMPTLQFHKVEYHAWKYQDTPASWAYLYEILAKEYYKKPDSIFSTNWIGYYSRLLKLNIKRKGNIPILKVLVILFFGALVFLVSLRSDLPTKYKEVIEWVGLPLSVIVTLYQLLIFLKKTYSSQAKDLFLMYSQKRSFKDHLGIQAEIQKEISTLLKVWIPSKSNIRLLIFVDDIDRCNEKKIIEIIDSLRIMLDDINIAKRVVVLSAIDERVLKRAIANKYYDLLKKDFDEEKSIKKTSLNGLVREYMDKLFIAGIKLNVLQFEDRKEILKTITRGKIGNLDDQATISETDESFNSVFTNEFAKNTETLVSDPALKKLNYTYRDSDFEITQKEYEFLCESLQDFTEATPRTIRIFYYRFLLAKRFLINSYKYNSELYKEISKPNFDYSILAYCILFYTINDSESNKLLVKSRENATEIQQIDILGRNYSIKSFVMKELLKIVEIVVPY